MASIKIEAFGGMLPTLDDRLLPNSNAANTQNVWLYDGKLEALRVPKVVYTLTDPSTRMVYRIPLNGPLAINIPNSIWLEFLGMNTSIVRSPVAGINDPSFYWAGNVPVPFSPRYTTLSRLQTTPKTNELILGILPPSNSVTVAPSGGASTVLENRAYSHTYVSAYGEEGPPSVPTAVITGKIDDTWVVTIPAVPVADRGDATKVVTAVSQAVHPTVAVAAHGYTVGMRIFFAGIVGMTQLNNLYATVFSVIDAGHFTINLDTTAFTPYVSGGTAQRIDREITKTRIYRTVATSQGTAQFQLVIELPIGSTSFNDTVTSAAVALNNPLISTLYFPPPALLGFVAMPNGILIGWFANQIWFCEPYKPWAWPAIYQLLTDTDIVGIGVVGQSAVICTNGHPYICTGTHPGNMVLSRVGSARYPCVSQGSIVNAPEGVYYMAEAGIILVGPGAPQLVTKGLASQDDWQRLVAVDRFRAAILNSAYYGYTSQSDGAFEPTAFEPTAFQETAVFDTRGGVFIDFTDQRIAFNRLFYSSPFLNVIKDPWSNEVLVIQGTNVCQIDLTSLSLEDQYSWKSKVFRMDYARNFSIARVFHTSPPGLAVPQSTVFNMYAARGEQEPVLIFSRVLPSVSGAYFRLPSGRIYDQYQFEFIGNLQIENFQIATSAKELVGV